MYPDSGLSAISYTFTSQSFPSCTFIALYHLSLNSDFIALAYIRGILTLYTLRPLSTLIEPSLGTASVNNIVNLMLKGDPRQQSYSISPISPLSPNPLFVTVSSTAYCAPPLLSRSPYFFYLISVYLSSDCPLLDLCDLRGLDRLVGGFGGTEALGAVGLSTFRFDWIGGLGIKGVGYSLSSGFNLARFACYSTAYLIS